MNSKINFKLIYSIVPQYSGELVTNAARDVGASGGTVLRATETSANGVIQLLGFGDATKDIALILTDSDFASTVIDSIKKSTCAKKKNFGILFSVNVGEFYKAGNNSLEDCKVCEEIQSEKKSSNLKSENQNQLKKENCDGEKSMNYKMINVIVNRGYAEDAMAAARKAGAAGGTIIQARGTAKEGDAKFFGTEIVPEKDMLLILVSAEKKDEIVNAIKTLKCFQKAGTGIIYCNDVDDFTVLGKE